MRMQTLAQSNTNSSRLFYPSALANFSEKLRNGSQRLRIAFGLASRAWQSGLLSLAAAVRIGFPPHSMKPESTKLAERSVIQALTPVASEERQQHGCKRRQR